MQISQFHICQDCGGLEELQRRLNCSILQLVRNKWTNQSYNTNLFFDRTRYKTLLRYNRILQYRLMNTNYLQACISNDVLNNLISKLLYKSDHCPKCPCDDFTNFIPQTTETSSTTTNTPPSSSTTTIAVTTTTSIPTSSTTTTLPEPVDSPVACATPIVFEGGNSFPTAQEVIIGSSTGNLTFNYDAFSIPDKFIVKIGGVEVVNTGYVGQSSYQADLDAELISRGMPTEAIVGPGSGTITFAKNTADTSAFVYIFAPLPNTQWNFTLECPVATTTTTLP